MQMERLRLCQKCWGGGKNDQKHTSIDALYRKYGRLDFIKMDIEGGEEEALKGAKIWMQECTSAKLAVCAYHKPESFQEITKMLEGLFQMSHTKGYMYFKPIVKKHLP